MPKRILWGRDATVTVGGTAMENLKDVTTTDTADDLSASARDLEYKVHHQGSKDLTLEFGMLKQETPTAAQAAVQTAYDDQTHVVVVVREKAGGQGIQFTGQVFDFSDDFAEDGAAIKKVVIKPSSPDPTEQPTRV